MKQTYKVSFGDVKVGKKTTIAIEIKGDLSDTQKLSLLQFANSPGFITLASAQTDIDDFEVPTPRKGITYSLNGDGTTEVDPDQLAFDDVIKEVEEVHLSEEEAKERMRIIAEENYDTTEEEMFPAEEPNDGPEPEEVGVMPEPEQSPLASVQALKPFQFEGKKIKKNEVILVPRAKLAMLVNGELVKEVDSSLPF